MTKLLLDESMPARLPKSFPPELDVRTVPRMGWASTKNGALLKLAADEGFLAFLTVDKNLEYQQGTIPIPVIVLMSHRIRLQDLEPFVPSVLGLIDTGMENRVYRLHP